MGLLRGARREVDAYERSRAAVSDLRSPDARLPIHALLIRIALAIDGVLESPTDAEREGSYGYLLSLAPGIDPLVRRLMPLAGQPITSYEQSSYGPEAPDVTAAAPTGRTAGGPRRAGRRRARPAA